MSSWPPVDLILNVCHLLKPPGTRLVLRRPVERSRSASPFIEDDLCMRVRPDRPMQPSVVRAPPWPRCFKVGALRRRLPRSASPQDFLPPRTTHSLLPVRRGLPRVTAPIPLLVAPQTSSKSRADLMPTSDCYARLRSLHMQSSVCQPSGDHLRWQSSEIFLRRLPPGDQRRSTMPSSAGAPSRAARALALTFTLSRTIATR